MKSLPSPGIHSALSVVLFLIGGCATPSYFDTEPELGGPVAVSTSADDELVRIRPIFTSTGAPLGWQDLLDACQWADVIVIGEIHDDAIGHAVQRAVVQDVMSSAAGDTALAMEMLERDEQQLVEDYYDGIIDAAQFARLTFSITWAGEGSWQAWYQPIIDTARDGGGRTIAANAPRRYVRLARTDGFGRLRTLPQPRSALFDIPTSLRAGTYRERFFELMSDMGDHSDPDDDATHFIPDDMIEAMFRAQMVWDATMAQSVVSALRMNSDRVILLVGQFHCDFNGGTVQELRRRSPTSRVLTISMQQRGGHGFNSDDLGRADIIIYTGARPVDDDDGESDEETETAHVPESKSATISPPGVPATRPHPPAPTPPHYRTRNQRRNPHRNRRTIRPTQSLGEADRAPRARRDHHPAAFR